MHPHVPPAGDDPHRNLLSGWNLGGEGPEEEDDDGSLFAPAVRGPSSRPAPTPPPPSTPSPSLSRSRSRPKDDDLFRGFCLSPAGARGDPADGPDSLLSPGAPAVSPPVASGGAADGPDPSEARPPEVGDWVSDFLLLTELGRGAFARVFLAEQVNLGRRLVALKVSRPEGEEPQMLARLQHTHIVPIHSVHDDPVSGFRLMCMPYLGGANLAQVIEAVAWRSAQRSHRRSLVDALDAVSRRLSSVSGATPSGSAGFGSRANRSGERPRTGLEPPVVLPGPRADGHPGGDPPGSFAASAGRGSLDRLQALWGRVVRRRHRPVGPAAALEDRDFDHPARQFLRTANIIQAAVWIVARLAEGLEHAHARGLLHRDLKPSNVLITGDGTPMLLDFNLSAPKQPDDPAEGEKAMLGGTLPYMAPEHLEAFSPQGNTPAEAVDERSDLYALGLILFEMIAGEHPFPEPPAGMPLLDLIRVMTQQRYTVPSLRAANPDVTPGLDAIVRKCLDPAPARRYARARDLAEDLNRYLADQPLKFAPDPSPRERLAKWARRNPRLCGASSVAGFGAVLVVALAGLIGVLTGNVQTIAARLKLQVFRADLAECRFLLNLAGGPAEHLTRGLALAERTLDHQGLRRDGKLREDSWVRRLTAREQAAVCQETAELILLQSRARVGLAGRAGPESDRARALESAVAALDRAEALDPDPPAALFADRARYHAALGNAGPAARDRAAADRRKPASARDHALLGTSRLAAGDVAGAESALLQAVGLDPKGFWAWFALGHCHLEQGRDLEAAGDFAACVALEPTFAWPYLNRGVALARAGRLREARDCYERALGANPRFAEAWVNLGLADLELNDLADAERALGRALGLGRDEIGVRVAWAEVKARRGDRAGAERLFAELLRDRRDDPVLLTARGIFRAGADPAGALRDLEHALEVNPRNARAHFGLALLSRRDDPRGALRHAEAALAIDPQMLDALQLRCLLRARLGDLAAVDDAERLCLVPTPHRLYNAACALSLLVETAHEPRLATRALGKLDRALDAGFPAAHAAADPDLGPLHPYDDFRKVLGRARGPGAP
jgi:serine/threonine protein kinase/tetratricopeptide (TPR) repeat protein